MRYDRRRLILDGDSISAGVASDKTYPKACRNSTQERRLPWINESIEVCKEGRDKICIKPLSTSSPFYDMNCSQVTGGIMKICHRDYGKHP